ncbi:hypothetical protein G7Y89_g7493 [Cudoniella acicularis]|uniref:N-acetyltransferase domain-containing protein n=1 Tax=Cudoniella acicularis TaxID=354080 RepID=A0A8H4RL29_9HELO|nr:hypothetical protein G7Y89_g7493 [Cudoniella acicularis]
MTFMVEVPKTEEDFFQMAEVRSLAFGTNQVYIDMLFPHHNTPSGRLKLRDRLLKIKELPSARFAVVRDSETGKIISQAEWHFYPKESVGDVMDLAFVEGTEEDKEYARHVVGTFQAKRREAIAQTSVPLMLLDSLTTDPAYQRRGAASMLVKWGLEMADSLNGEAYLEATEFGKPVYKKLDFKVLGYYVVPVPPKWSNRPPIECYLMRRPAVKKSIVEA